MKDGAESRLADGGTRIDDPAVTAISNWIMDASLAGIDADKLLKGFCERVVALGIPLKRARVACSFLHPMFRAFSVDWNPDKGVIRSRFAHAGAMTDAWLKSPFKAVVDEEDLEIRCRISQGEGIERFPVIEELRNQGFTDYLCLATLYSPGTRETRSILDGSLSSWTTDDPAGFSDGQLKTLRHLVKRLNIGLKIYVREMTTQHMLLAYLGNHAGSRVLDGQIKLGDGDMINAAIWFSDMRGSTATADRMPADLFLDRLNRYFQVTAGAVLDHGGEVLRFIGDAVLAIFPISGPGGADRAARMAISAARDAERRLAVHNADLPPHDPEPIDFGLGLHVGAVLFGNIGVPERVEFSVIGHTANEVARLQDLTKELGQRIVASDAFSSLTQASWEPMGSFRLRGVTEPQAVYALRSKHEVNGGGGRE